jgi:predicted nuclease of predicted toxin-antitoxin system
VRFLIDNALSPEVARALRDLGHDAIHVRDVGRQRSSDADIFDFAVRERGVIVSADSDFAQILALRRASAPSLVLLRDGIERAPSRQPPLIHRWTSIHERALDVGAVLTIQPGRCRVRRLPIEPPRRRRRGGQ